MSADSPDAIRADIEATRAELASEIEDLNDKVNPARVVERKIGGAKDAVSNVKDKVMGKASEQPPGITAAASADAKASRMAGVASGVSSAASAAAGAIASSPAAAKQKAAGSPFVAGGLAFGVGYLVSTLLPASQKERATALAMKRQGEPVMQPLKQGLTAAVGEVKDNLAPAAQAAVDSVQSTATEAARDVKEAASPSTSDAQPEGADSGRTGLGFENEKASDQSHEETRPEQSWVGVDAGTYPPDGLTGPAESGVGSTADPLPGRGV